MRGCSLVCLWQIPSSRLQLHGVVLWRSVPRLWRLCHTKKATGMSQSLDGMFVVCVTPTKTHQQKRNLAGTFGIWTWGFQQFKVLKLLQAPNRWHIQVIRVVQDYPTSKNSHLRETNNDSANYKSFTGMLRPSKINQICNWKMTRRLKST